MFSRARIYRLNLGLVRLRSTGSLGDVESELAQGKTDILSHTNTVPVSKAKIGQFFQSPPKLGNQFEEDTTLTSALKRILPVKVLEEISSDLKQFGARVGGELRELGEDCEREPPYLLQYHPWGRRVDRLITSPAWKKQKAVSAEEGLISTAYKRQHGPWSRLHQVAKLYLYSPSSGFYWCPLAMTDGAATIIETLDNPSLASTYEHLTSQDPQSFWTSGQWMTERKGGSDVGNGTETLAIKQEDGSYRLYGYKWFSSATDSDISFTLARILDESGQPIPGSQGLSMFYLETRGPDGELNGIEIQRLKDKLGTRGLPTAELLLDGTKAMLVSDQGRGVAAIAEMLTISRIHTTIYSTANMRRIINLARDYSHRRVVFGSKIKDHSLHVKHLANMEVEQRAALLLTVEMARLLGHEEVAMATEEDKNLLRLLTPVSKLYTGKQAVAVASEGLECFGGMGYLEDTGLPLLLRDAQVQTIWEGTTNILCLDVLRSIVKTKGGVLKAFHAAVSRKCSTASPEVSEASEKIQKAANEIIHFAAMQSSKVLELGAREFAFSIARIFMGSLLVEHASWSEASPMDVLAAKRWCQNDLIPVVNLELAGHYTQDAAELEYRLVFDGYTNTDS